MLYLLPKTAGRLVFLEYKNDLELENASEEAVALYMRVSNLQKHVNDIVKKKSDYVNENDVFFYIKINVCTKTKKYY